MLTDCSAKIIIDKEFNPYKKVVFLYFIISEVLSESARSAFSSKTDDISNKKGKNASFCVKSARIFKSFGDRQKIYFL